MTYMFSNRAFRRGFAQGLASPFRVFCTRSTIKYIPRATDAAAWRSVGDLLNHAYFEVAEEIGKTSHKTTEKRRKSR